MVISFELSDYPSFLISGFWRFVFVSSAINFIWPSFSDVLRSESMHTNLKRSVSLRKFAIFDKSHFILSVF